MIVKYVLFYFGQLPIDIFLYISNRKQYIKINQVNRFGNITPTTRDKYEKQQKNNNKNERKEIIIISQTNTCCLT